MCKILKHIREDCSVNLLKKVNKGPDGTYNRMKIKFIMD